MRRCWSGWILLHVIVREGSAVFKLFACKDEALLFGWATRFLLDVIVRQVVNVLEPFACEDKALLPAGWEEYYLHRGEGQDEG
jgi:hypothetical protein